MIADAIAGMMHALYHNAVLQEASDKISMTVRNIRVGNFRYA
ncbi:hypothetical protein W822_16120 [Advenella kashmirensis W13003]|uniref:Uncharacterized protein n=1 Tax=Advenella kashmirensis W13003 TaxID=1424334 RepID=V8QS22_9BURK|nr:hypothetical protein W822_16120 [Advenella kashmirensis W13003]